MLKRKLNEYRESYSQEKLDEIHDKLIDVGYGSQWEYAMNIIEDEFGFDVMDMLNEKKKRKVLFYIQKQIEIACKEFESIPKIVMQNAINDVREDEELGDDISDEEIEEEYKDKVYRYAKDIRNILDEDFSENWKDLIEAVGSDIRDDGDLLYKLNRVDDKVLEVIEEIEEVYKLETRDAFKEVFY